MLPAREPPKTRSSFSGNPGRPHLPPPNPRLLPRNFRGLSATGRRRRRPLQGGATGRRGRRPPPRRAVPSSLWLERRGRRVPRVTWSRGGSGGEQGVWGLTSLAPPKGFPDANRRALGGSRRWRMKQGEESAAVEKIKYSRGSGTQIFSGTASGLEGWPGVPRRVERWGFTGGRPPKNVASATPYKL